MQDTHTVIKTHRGVIKNTEDRQSRFALWTSRLDTG